MRGATVPVKKKLAFSLFASFAPTLGVILQKIATTKQTFPKNLIVHIILILDASIVPNLMFLGLLSPGISFGEQSPTQTDTRPGPY